MNFSIYNGIQNTGPQLLRACILDRNIILKVKFRKSIHTDKSHKLFLFYRHDYRWIKEKHERVELVIRANK